MNKPKRTAEERQIVREARKHRPRCMYCRAPMEPVYTYCRDPDRPDRIESMVTGIRGYGYAAENMFCSLRCGYAFAIRHLESTS